MTKWLPQFVAGCAAGLTAGWAAQAHAGARIESEVMVNASKPVDSVLELQGDRFRIDLLDHSTGETLHSTIFDGTRILQLMAKDKTYTAMTMADLKTQMQRLDQMRASTPAGAQLDKGKTVDPVYTFTRAPGGETIAGFPCDNYGMTRDGKNGGIVCLTSWKHTGPVTKADLAPMRKLSDQLRSFDSHSIGNITMGPDLEKWPGWPLGTVSADGRQRTHVTKISRTTFPASDFKPPADYTLKPPPVLRENPHGHQPGQ
jgi:hypothetical protein